MFWRKKRAEKYAYRTTSELFELARILGVERRQNVRIRFPSGKLESLPKVIAGGSTLFVQDISLGGCCLHDPLELLGPHVGQVAELVMAWPDQTYRVQSKIVARIDHRRHIQFLDFPTDRIEILKKGMEPGVRAQLMRITSRTTLGPKIKAKELWTSIAGDSLQVFDEIHMQAIVTAHLLECNIMRQAWPVRADKSAISKEEFESLLIFLRNISSPTPALTELLTQLEMIFSERGD